MWYSMARLLTPVARSPHSPESPTSCSDAAATCHMCNCVCTCRFFQGRTALLTLEADLASSAGPHPVDCTVAESGRGSVSVAVAADAADALTRRLRRLRSGGSVTTARLDLAARDPTAHRQLEALSALGNPCDASNEYEVRRPGHPPKLPASAARPSFIKFD